MVDGLGSLELKIPCKAIVKGDQISSSIAAASIIAKVDRDHKMSLLHEKFPEYEFRSNKGYGTKAHLDALTKIGASSIHRKTFAPVATVIKKR